MIVRVDPQEEIDVYYRDFSQIIYLNIFDLSGRTPARTPLLPRGDTARKICSKDWDMVEADPVKAGEVVQIS